MTHTEVQEIVSKATRKFGPPCRSALEASGLTVLSQDAREDGSGTMELQDPDGRLWRAETTVSEIDASL